MWHKQQSLCSRSVWGAEGEASSNQLSLISLLIKTRSKLDSISLIEYCMTVELRSCLSLFGKGQPCAIVSWPACFQALEETIHTQPKLLPQGGVFLFVYLGFCFVFKINPWRTATLDHKDIWNLWRSFPIHPLWQPGSKIPQALKLN